MNVYLSICRCICRVNPIYIFTHIHIYIYIERERRRKLDSDTCHLPIQVYAGTWGTLCVLGSVITYIRFLK